MRYLKNIKDYRGRFDYINKVDSGYMTKKQVEEVYGEYYTIQYDRMVKFAEEELERKALKFGKEAKMLLADAILAHILVESYLNNVYNKKKNRNGFWGKLLSFFSKK